ncbi:metal-dependent hydrolase [Methanoregula formicica SMSP]|uniref:Metal-dependent hydrolase n=2 Tax=Methanoregula formicica TaxID=882104 RepID=L0HCV4_METFS|nr:metal-dependent hydrolase [Methanoregula formicica SMSP]
MNDMADSLRIGSFNVQNLFQRAKALNYQNHDNVDKVLQKIQEFKDTIEKNVYTDNDKQKIFEMYTGELWKFIEVRENRGKLFSRKGQKITGVQANGRGDDWDGEINFKPDPFDKLTRENTAKVIRDLKADVLCIVEAEDRPTLKAFDAQMLKSHYACDMLMDGNDDRGIDVGLYSKFPLGAIHTHIFDKKGRSEIFSRDAPEYEVRISDKQSLVMVCNHLKSKGYDSNNTADKRRKEQAVAVAGILAKYDLQHDWVVVAGDFNDTPDSPQLEPLLSVPDLYDVLSLQFGNDMAKRWTYHYKAFEQIDYVLVSKPLKDRFVKAGVVRNGMYNLEKMTKGSGGKVPVETEYPSVTKWSDAASDHGAVWADFRL